MFDPKNATPIASMNEITGRHLVSSPTKGILLVDIGELEQDGPVRYTEVSVSNPWLKGEVTFRLTRHEAGLVARYKSKSGKNEVCAFESVAALVEGDLSMPFFDFAIPKDPMAEVYDARN